MNRLKQGKEVWFECPCCSHKAPQYLPQQLMIQGIERLVWMEQRKCPECGSNMVKHAKKVRLGKGKGKGTGKGKEGKR